MSLAYRVRRRWDARSDRERTALLVVFGVALYLLLALTADYVIPAGTGLP
jgi:hypothetical protein